MSDLDAFLEELDTLHAIFGPDFSVSPDASSCRLTCCLTDGDANEHLARDDVVSIKVSFPETGYPSTTAPHLSYVDFAPFSFPVGEFPSRTALMESLEQFCKSTFVCGEVTVYTWLDHITSELRRLYALQLQQGVSAAGLDDAEEPVPTDDDGQWMDDDDPAAWDWKNFQQQSGEKKGSNTTLLAPVVTIHAARTPIIDRKSVFQGFCVAAKTVAEFEEARAELKKNGKVARSTHVIWAFRMRDDKVWRQDCDDDGETAAGGRLLALLQILNVENAAVFVVRWYGGIQLGPQRFKHINQAARDVLTEAGIIK